MNKLKLEARLEDEKILSISADEYFKMTGKNPRGYTPVGVHVAERCKSNFFVDGYNKVSDLFKNRIPENTEVVVGYSQTLIYNGEGASPERLSATMDGTALVPNSFF